MTQNWNKYNGAAEQPSNSHFGKNHEIQPKNGPAALARCGIRRRCLPFDRFYLDLPIYQECMLNIQHTGVLGAETMPCALFLPPAGPQEFALGIYFCHCLSFGAAPINHEGAPRTRFPGFFLPLSPFTVKFMPLPNRGSMFWKENPGDTRRNTEGNRIENKTL
jgi:hypothetical protein